MDANILDTLNAHQLGQELQNARKKRGLTQEQAAEIIGVARTTITAIEKGERRIKPGELIKLARAYGRQIGDFVRTRPQIEAFSPIFRGPYLASAEDEVKIKNYVEILEDLCRDYLELEQITGAPLLKKYPSEEDITGLDPEQAGEDIASRQRKSLGLGDGPVPPLRDVLEREIGLRIFYIEMRPTQYSEMYIYEESLGACLAVNSLHPEERQRWSLAHGYAHFLIDRYKPILLVENGYERLPMSERFADAFARYFLMPTDSLRRQYNNIVQARKRFTVADLLTLANYYGVSVAALTLRLEDLRMLPTGTWGQIRDSGLKIREAQGKLGLASSPKHESILPIRFQYLAVYALDSGDITEGQFARFLRVAPIEARQIAEDLRVHNRGITDDVSIELNITQPLGDRE